MTTITAFNNHWPHTMVLLAALLPCFAIAQQADDSLPSSTQQEYLRAIEGIEDERGPNAAALVEPLMALSRFYFEQGEHELAADGFAQARAIVRTNHGISTMQEVELLEWEVKAQEAIGNFAAGWELEQNMLVMLGEHTGNLATYPIYSELARKRLDVLKRYYGGEFPPQIVLGCYYGKARDRDAVVMGDTVLLVTTESKKRCGSGDRDTVLITLVREARTYQALAIEALLQNDRYAGSQLQDLVNSFLRSSETLRRLMPQYGDRLLSLVMTRITSYEPSDIPSAQAQAMFIIQLADLNVRRSYGASRPAGFDEVIAQYQHAYTRLKDSGLSQRQLNEIFSPSVPIMLPAFETNPLMSQANEASGRYIDIAFDVTRYGRSRNIEIIDATDDVERREKRELIRVITEHTFRPVLSGEQFADSSPAQFRYHLPPR